MNWQSIWMQLFNTTEFLGINMGFWVSMAVTLILVILMNIIFWSQKPYKKDKTNEM